MFPRTLTPYLLEAARRYPVVTITGPRQSGKTTLAKTAFSGYRYVSLENPDERAFANEDARGFLGRFTAPVILDEAQRCPELFSYIQTLVDEDDTPGRFVMSGSQNFLLLQSVSQSLAGRTALFDLLPFSLAELRREEGISLDALLAPISPKPLPASGPMHLYKTLFTGFYPRIHDKKIPPQDWLQNYYQTYLQRDVRDLLQVGDLEAFSRFVRLCAGRAGQLLNFNNLAVDAGITHTTARRWLSVLEASYIIFRLQPHARNFNKRLIKSPKLYFWDTGLLVYLLGIQSADGLFSHAAKGAIFETFIISELMKKFVHAGRRPSMFFWRDASGHEVDCLLEWKERLIPIEIKSSQTFHAEYLTGLNYWLKLSGTSCASLFYGGEHSYQRSGVSVYNWQQI
ncbi:MAG: ATP-binding protein [Gammaproteobacteria bacterium]|nr:ATP-binding protein [Gammaproteobacteria bacterium]